jgi:hypothetical protein
VSVVASYQADDDSGPSDQNTFVNDPNFITLVSESSGESATYDISDTSTTTPTERDDGASSEFLFTEVPAGFHWVIVNENYNNDDPTNTFENNWTYRISYQTERYQCPFDENYPDVTGIFQGCIFPRSTNQLPCIEFNTVTLVCSTCLTGYTLTSGVCLVNPCPENQYRRFGICLPNPVGCKVFDDFTLCQECVDETYALTNGTCTRVPLVCPDRTYYEPVAYVCAPVSERCDTFNTTNGQCLTCVMASDALNEMGECVMAVDIGCTDRQYVMNGVCINVEAICFAFEKIGGKCTQCIFGYEFNA